jgi:hypothetical protein
MAQLPPAGRAVATLQPRPFWAVWRLWPRDVSSCERSPKRPVAREPVAGERCHAGGLGKLAPRPNLGSCASPAVRGRLMAGLQRILTLVVAAVLTSAHVQPAPAQRAPIANVPSADAEMNAAIAKARATLPTFWGSFEKPGKGEERFTLKVYFQVDRPGGPRRSHVWVESIERLANGRLAGRLSNDPQHIEGKATASNSIRNRSPTGCSSAMAKSSVVRRFVSCCRACRKRKRITCGSSWKNPDQLAGRRSQAAIAIITLSRPSAAQSPKDDAAMLGASWICATRKCSTSWSTAPRCRPSRRARHPGRGRSRPGGRLGQGRRHRCRTRSQSTDGLGRHTVHVKLTRPAVVPLITCAHQTTLLRTGQRRCRYLLASKDMQS